MIATEPILKHVCFLFFFWLIHCDRLSPIMMIWDTCMTLALGSLNKLLPVRIDILEKERHFCHLFSFVRTQTITWD